MEPRHLPHPLYSPLGFKKCTENTGDTDDSNSESIIVVIVNWPEQDRGDLEDIEWVKYLVDKETKDGFGGDINDVFTHEDLSLFPGTGI
jgi:hypothetical protein